MEEDEEDVGALSQAGQEGLLKVKKIVIVMMENRSFDHYFGHLTIKGADGRSQAEKYDYRGGKPDQREGDRRVNGLTGTEWNPTSPGGTQAEGVKVFDAHSKSLGYSIGDINHEWVECHAQWNPVPVGPQQMPTQGRMDGFIIEHLRDRGELGDLKVDWSGSCNTFPKICEQGTQAASGLICATEAKDTSPEGKRAACGHPDAPMAYYTRRDTPVFHGFYDNFVLCDNWYASVCGPTWPNRYYVHSGTAGAAYGTNPKRDRRDNLDTIFKVLAASNIPFFNFFGDAPLVEIMYGRDANFYLDNSRGQARVFDKQGTADKLFSEAARAGKGSMLTGGLGAVTSAFAWDESFETRCKKGNLPPVSYVEPPYFCADDHPPHDIQLGQAFVKSIYDMLYGGTANREQADSTLLIVMYDEHGSFYDHQDPGLAFAQSSGRFDADRNFQPLGFRIPAMIVGPMVKRSHVSHTVYDHCSVLKTIYNWVQVHSEQKTGLFRGIRQALPEAKGAQTRQMIDEIYRAGYSQTHPLRPLHASNQSGFIHKPMLRVLAANDISDCLNPNYSPGSGSMPQMPRVTTTEGRVLASMQYSEGQTGIAAGLGVRQPSRYAKEESAKEIMEHLSRLGAVDIG